MDPPSIFSKASLPHDGNLSNPNMCAPHLEELPQVKCVPPKLPQDNPREMKMETMKSPGHKMSELLKEKEEEWTSLARKAGPLQLLDLPLDLLREILTEITHTNDLASLALTCSAMHAVVTPLIYCRFDIVWPDSSSSSDARSGVDALTYGLATLVMREDLFENAMLPKSDPTNAVCHNYCCTECGAINRVRKTPQPSNTRRLRRGNYFSQFTKKFSLGNGPPDWVKEYLVTKESGKMLGTLVALSIARMPNLESFVWDMPTGILRDIWISLSSLGEYVPSKLSKVWVRFHDNKTASQDAELVYPAPAKHDNVMLPYSSIPIASMPSYHKLEFTGHPTEYPNFSTLPPLQSLTVLAIDELAYLEEISEFIGTSRSKLRELRIGLAPKINTSSYDAYHPTVQLFAAGTELALLFNVLHDSFDPRSKDYIYRPKPPLTESPSNNVIDEKDSSQVTILETPVVSESDVSASASNGSLRDSKVESDSTFGLSEPMTRMSFSPEGPLNYASIDPALSHVLSPPGNETITPEEARHVLDAFVPRPDSESSAPPVLLNEAEAVSSTLPDGSQSSALSSGFPTRQTVDSEDSDLKLRLETLELEGCLLNVFVLAQSIDFSMLTSLTLLNCEAADILWAQLSRQFPALNERPSSDTPSVKPNTNPAVQKSFRRISTGDSMSKGTKYQLNLKRIHTDAVSSSLITFLSKFLAPNSLEWLFLQNERSFVPPVTIDAIYKGPLRRHRASLTKVMIDSSSSNSASTVRTRNTDALRWMLSRDLIGFITSGKMNKLRELAMVVEYKDWHYFLQRLPSIPHLRSLYVPHIVNHVYGTGLNIKELAMGVVDVVTLRPEIELCYLGIFSKCFEILERKPSSKRPNSLISNAASSQDSDDDSDDDDYHQGDHDGEAGEGSATMPVDFSSPPEESPTDAVEQEGDSTGSSEDETPPANVKVKYKLREILFYDDKISIFKARHGKL